LKTIKVGVIGKGFIGPAHVEALRRLGDVEIVAIAGSDEAESKEKAEALGIPFGTGDYRKLIQQEDVQVVHICSPNYLHYPMAKEALEAGKHVVCEKPLAVKVAEGEKLLRLAEKMQCVHAVHFNLRYYPLMHQVHQMVLNRELGEIFAVHGSYLQDWLFYSTDYNWRLESSLSGASRAVADIGSHWLDLIEYLTGLKITEVLADFATFHKIRKKPLKPVEIYAGKILRPNDYQDIDISTEDYASVLLHFNNGAHGAVTVNQVAAGRKNRLSFEIDGSKKAVAWESEIPNQLWIGNRDGNNELMLKDPSLVHPEVRSLIDYPGGHNEGFPDTVKQLYKEIYTYIGAGNLSAPAPFPTFADGLRGLVLGEKILESNKKAIWVKL
jgi:predicted dehydrogenase